MKALLRSAFVQDLLAWLIVTYVRLIGPTMRWRYQNRESADVALAGEKGGIVLVWHGRIAFAMLQRDYFGPKRKQVMISLSRDGEFIAKAAERLGVPTIRGSTGRGEKMFGKGGPTAFRKALACIEAGEAVVVMPDGPRGPNQVMPMGPVQLAKSSRSQVWLGGFAGRPALKFDSWDEARLPLPFSRGCLVVEGPFFVAGDADEAAMEGARAQWQETMRAAQRRAEAILGGAA
jgi:hypothetical protein